MTVRRAPYQPDQEISDYTARDLATSSAITGDFTTDSLKYGFGPTSLSAEDEEFPDWVDHFLPGPNINPHDDPAYDEPYVKCETNYDCPNPARTGPFNYSGGYIGKITACRGCWQDILELYEEEFQGKGVVQPSGTAWQDEWAAEDNTDDLSSDQLIRRMDEIGQRMDEIVQRHGGSYEKAERDPAYLRLVNQHTALARAYARRHGFDAEEPPMDIEEEAQARLEAIRQLQWGVRVIDRMLREGNLDDAIAFTRATVNAMDQEEAADRELGLDPDRFSAESDEDELYYIQLRPKFARGMVYHRKAFSNLEDAQSEARILSLEFPAKHRGVLGITKGKGYPYNFMLTKSSCKMCGADSENPCVCMIGPEVRPCSDKPIKKWQSDSVMYQPCPCSDVTDGFSAESDPVSRIAAGTNDALADFANAHDTDDGFYLIGGLIGGLAIAVAGNVLADRLQDWWGRRSA